MAPAQIETSRVPIKTHIQYHPPKYAIFFRQPIFANWCYNRRSVKISCRISRILQRKWQQIEVGVQLHNLHLFGQYSQPVKFSLFVPTNYYFHDKCSLVFLLLQPHLPRCQISFDTNL